jgi:hypothetical protein
MVLRAFRQEAGADATLPYISQVVATAVYDGRDRLTLQNNWFLIKDGDDFYLEHAHTGLDIGADELSISPSFSTKRWLLMAIDGGAFMKILGGPPPQELVPL